MKTKPRADIPAEELFLLKIKYGTDLVNVYQIQETDYKYFKKIPASVIEARIDEITIRIKDLLDFDGICGSVWRQLICDEPEFAKYCNWNKLSGGDWSELLSKHPQYSRHIATGTNSKDGIGHIYFKSNRSSPNIATGINSTIGIG